MDHFTSKMPHDHFSHNALRRVSGIDKKSDFRVGELKALCTSGEYAAIRVFVEKKSAAKLVTVHTFCHPPGVKRARPSRMPSKAFAR
jgi:hypothetical protein